VDSRIAGVKGEVSRRNAEVRKRNVESGRSVRGRMVAVYGMPGKMLISMSNSVFVRLQW
jgi:hypothetical protein